MLKLLKWATIGAVAFVVYEILSTLLKSDEPVAAAVRDAVTPPSPAPAAAAAATGPVLSGAEHQGATTSVRNADGSEHRQVVGRGVIHR